MLMYGRNYHKCKVIILQLKDCKKKKELISSEQENLGSGNAVIEIAKERQDELTEAGWVGARGLITQCRHTGKSGTNKRTHFV